MGEPTATPTGIPRLRMNPYMQAAIGRSSALAMACVPTLTPVNTMPFPTPNTAKAIAETALAVRSSKRMNRPHPRLAMARPSQMAQRKRPRREVNIATTTEPGTRRQTAGNRSIPARTGEALRTDMR